MNKSHFRNLLTWSMDHYADLPWRKKRSLYGTLVSEIMLQQTTVTTVLNHYTRFLNRFPTIFDLARATEEEVAVAWKGLGYYRRAKNLRSLAIQIVDFYGGEIPTELSALIKLKGIGPYTSNAMVAIGADKRALAVDANLERVLARYYGLDEEKGVSLQKKIHADFLQYKILPHLEEFGARKTNEALMDLGRVICQSRKATCTLCPLQESCQAFKAGTPERFARAKIVEEAQDHKLDLLRIIVRRNNKILFYQKSEGQWLSGQWELPTFVLSCTDKKLKQYPKLKSKFQVADLKKFKTGITKYTITNHVAELTLEEFKQLVEGDFKIYVFKIFDELLNLSTASIKALKKK